MTNAKQVTLLVLALCMLVTFVVVLERQASARAEAEGGSAIVRSGDGLIRAEDGCALVENGDRTIVAGSCGEQRDPIGQDEQILPPEEDTTLIPETASPGSTPADGAIPTGEEQDLCPTKPPGDAARATIARAVDGDTLVLADEVGGTDRVRLTGVDAPELEGEDGTPEPYAEEAVRFTANALEGKDVVLVPGEEETDNYGRLLAYVWTAPEKGLLGGLKRLIGAGRPEFFNQKLLREGYAETLTIRPNDAFANCFEAAQRKAQDAGEGIWGPQETSHFEETTSSTYVTSPESASSESAPESTATTVAEQAITPDDAPEETVYSQEGNARLEQAVTGESDAAIRQQYKDAPPTAPASQDPSEETTSIARRGPTSLPVGSLPVADTPHAGTVPVLPETGGTSLLALFGAMGLISLVLAALSANSSPGDRPNENRDEER